MDKSQVKAIVEAALPGYVALFGLERWRITLEFGPLKDSNAAECGHNIAYTTATISFDPERHGDEAGVLENLRHELFHLIHASFDMFYNVALTGMSEERTAVCDRAWTFSAEQTVVALETLYARMLAAPRKKGPGR